MKILAKIYKIWKYMKKCSLIHATITCTKQVECALWFQFRWAHHQSKEVGCLDPGLSLVGWYLGGPWYQGGANNCSALHVHSVIFQLKTNIQQHLTKYYLEKCMDHMNDGSYQLLKYDPTTKINAKTLKQLKALLMAMSLLIIKNNIWNLLTFLHLDFMVNRKYKNQEFLFILLHCTILTINT